jgi:hypothetical protein
MPRGDGTGPAGMGPMTGRAGGFCAGYPAPGYMNPVGGRGFGFWGRGRGGGRGWRNRYYATGWPGWAGAGVGYPAWGGAVAPLAGPVTPAPQQELEALRGQAEYFESALGQIKERIDQLEAQAKE